MRIGGSAILALAFGDREITCCLTDGKGNARVVRKIACFDAASPLLDRPEMTGQALAQFLDQHQFNASRAIVGVPARWVIAQEKEIPPTDASAAISILRLQAERMSTGDAGGLVVDTAGDVPAGTTKVLLVGMLKGQVDKIHKLIESAKLQLVAICPTTLAASALLESDHVMLSLAHSGAEFVQWQGGAARTLRPLVSVEPQQVAIELKRILAMTGAAGQLRVCDGIDEIGKIGMNARSVSINELNARIDPAAMNGSAASLKSIDHLPAVALSLAGLDRARLPVNFIDSRLAPEKTRRFGRTAYMAMAAGVAIVVGIVSMVMTVHAREAEEVMLAQQIKKLEPDVKAAQARVDRFKFGRSYFENRGGNLDCVRQLALAYNYDEPIWATGITIRDHGEGTLQGKSTDQRLILSLRDRLMNDKTFKNVQLLDLREAGGRGGEITYSISFVYGQTEVRK